jgi:hypothetical protein
MIQLRSDCLVFKTAQGHWIPCSAELLSVELIGEAAASLEPDFVRHAVAAVLHYFKHDQGKIEVSLGEFSEALERVLRGCGLSLKTSPAVPPAPGAGETDLSRLACESGKGYELVFFGRLRAEVRRLLAESPRLVRFTGLRSCVKQLAGTRRWSPRCERLSDQIVTHLRGCFDAERRQSSCALLVF